MMSDSLVHRGPDSSGIWSSGDGTVILGHRRLSIIAAHSGASQPMATRDGRHVLAYNGEIYNFKDLPVQVSATMGDTAAMLALWKDLGPASLPKLRGMFAFAMYDRADRSLYLARDRFGIKPLFYSCSSNGTLVFASEIKALVLSGMVPLEWDTDALWAFRKFLTVPGVSTAYRAIKQVPPGFMLRWRNGRCELESWAPAFHPPRIVDRRSHQERLDGLRAHLESAANRQLISERPITLLLSGGLDSGAIAASVQDRELTATAVSFGGDNQQDVDGARATSRWLDMDLNVLTLSHVDLVDEFQRMIHSHDQPFADAAGMVLGAVCRQLSGQMVVVLQGDGGDEVFFGYRMYARALMALRFGSFRKILLPFARFPRASRRGILIQSQLEALAAPDDRVLAQLSGIAHTQLPLSRGLGPRLLDSQPEDLVIDAHYIDAWNESRGLSPAQRVLEVDRRTRLHDLYLPKVDRASMNSSIEVRVPILDEDLVDYVRGLPDRDLVGGVRTKRILRAALHHRLPHQVVYGSKKGFGVPVDRWMRESLGVFAREVFSDKATIELGLIHSETALADLDAHEQGKPGLGPYLFALLALAVWGVQARSLQVGSTLR